MIQDSCNFFAQLLKVVSIMFACVTAFKAGSQYDAREHNTTRCDVARFLICLQQL